MIPLLKLDSIESGTNHIKFPYGTLIQMGTYTHTVTESNVVYGSFNMEFPIAFIDDNVFMFCSNIYSYARDIVYSVHPIRTSATIYFTYETGQLYTGNTVSFKWLAIGRWK